MRPAALLLLLTLAPLVAKAQTSPSLEVQAKSVLQQYMDAERNFDPVKLAKLVSRNYVEVSPLGEVDGHDRFLGFYAPANKIPTPLMTLTEDHFSTFSNDKGGVYIGKLVWHLESADGAAHDDELRVTWIFAYEDGELKVQSAQYTPLRMKKT